jgi:hypothetical protein
MCEFKGEDVVDSEARKHLTVIGIMCMQDWCHVMRNVKFHSTNHSSVVTDTDLRCTI